MKITLWSVCGKVKGVLKEPRKAFETESGAGFLPPIKGFQHAALKFHTSGNFGLALIICQCNMQVAKMSIFPLIFHLQIFVFYFPLREGIDFD
jgi:hypothetical protein